MSNERSCRFIARQTDPCVPSGAANLCNKSQEFRCDCGNYLQGPGLPNLLRNLCLTSKEHINISTANRWNYDLAHHQLLSIEHHLRTLNHLSAVAGPASWNSQPLSLVYPCKRLQSTDTLLKLPLPLVQGHRYQGHNSKFLLFKELVDLLCNIFGALTSDMSE